MSEVSPLLRWVGWAVTAMLVTVMVALVIGHRAGAAAGLDLTHSYVSEYEAQGPHWPWIVLASLIFGALLVLLAFGFLMRVDRSAGATIGCLMLAAASMAMFFVSYAPVRRLQEARNEVHGWWSPRAWMETEAAHSSEMDAAADAFSGLHYRATELALVNGLVGIFVLAAGLLWRDQWRRFAMFTLAAAVLMAVLFIAGDHGGEWRGLWQRLGFALMYVWLWAARVRLTLPGV
jgi:hypothetical protein